MEHFRASRRASPSYFQFSQRQGPLHLRNGFEKGIQSLTVVDVGGWYHLFQLTRDISSPFPTTHLAETNCNDGGTLENFSPSGLEMLQRKHYRMENLLSETVFH